MDYNNFPYVGPEGYESETDSEIWQGCKWVPDLEYGVLLGSIGDGDWFVVGRSDEDETFTADNDGALFPRLEQGTQRGKHNG